MTDEPGIFTPFTPAPAPEAPAPKPKRRSSGKRKIVAKPDPAPAAPAKRRGRKPRTDKHVADVAVPKPEDAQLFTHLVSTLQKIKKGQRERIVSALAKVFG